MCIRDRPRGRRDTARPRPRRRVTPAAPLQPARPTRSSALYLLSTPHAPPAHLLSPHAPPR
eukprot:5688754-Prymnesium_polylepis.1